MYEISEELLNKIGSYLGKQPYVEVAALIFEMRKLEKINFSDKQKED